MSQIPVIRPIVHADFQKWLPLWDGYQDFYKRSGPTAISEIITQTTWSRFLEDQEPMHALVAELDGELLGLAHYIFHRNTTLLAPTCYLQDLFTQENARGKGVGRALIEAVYLKAQAAGSGRVYWQTHETNLQAMKLYDKMAERSGFLVYRKQL